MKFDNNTNLSAIHADDDNQLPRYPPRAILTEKQAAEIYQYRISNSRFSPLGSATIIARKYNVSPKTVRDIWNRRTWTQETRHLWSEDQQAMVRRDNRRCSTSSASNSSDSEHEPACGRSSSASRRPSRAPIAWIENRDSGCGSSWCDFFVNSIKRSGSSEEWGGHFQQPTAELVRDFGCCTAAAGPSVDEEEVEAGCGEGWGSPSLWRWEAGVGAWDFPCALGGSEDPFHGDWPHW
jgi:hypothetical protein